MFNKMNNNMDTKIENIIQAQCYKLAQSIEDNTKLYKPFIGKY